MESKYKITSTNGKTIYLDSPIISYSTNFGGVTKYNQVHIQDLSQHDIDLIIDQFKGDLNGKGGA